MAPQNPTIIVGHLDDSELTKSIDKLVSEVAKKTSGMAEDFTQAIDKMKLAMKDFAITQKVSVDLMKEAWRDMSKSFDAMVAAQSASTGGGKGSGKGKVYAPNTVGALEQEIALEREKRREMQLGSDVLRDQNRLLEQRQRTLKQETTSLETNVAKAFQTRIGNVISLPSKSFADANEKLRRLRELLDDMQKRAFLFDESKINRVKNAIDSVETKIERMRKKWGQQGQQPNTLQQVLGMDENSFDAISKKMAALKKLSWSNPIEQKRIIDEYQRLRQEQTKLMASNAQMTRSNNYLAQSFGYIRNRIVYALTLGAMTNFIKQIYEIRGQYELLERSLGVLVNSFERGSQVFNELNQMAIESPFTLMELAGAAKQLTAYNFAANEVVDTTRRLADISAALGVPMERLTYNLGQIRAQTVLNARDARDFANAGLPIVKSLSDYYTELEGKIVSTGDVYDRMSKKMVSYNDVMAVLNKMTDEGGKFFEFQAKQAQTLRVQMANLTLAWNNMLNEMGRGNQGLLSLPIQGLKAMLQNWASLNRVLKNVVLSFGLLKVAQMAAIRYNWQLAASAGGAARMMGFLGNAIKSVVASTRALLVNPWTWIFVGIMAITDLIGKWRAARQEIAELNDELKENANEAANSNLDFLNNKGNIETRRLAKENKLTSEQGKKAWEAIEQQISTSAMSANKLLGELWAIDDVNKRVEKGFDYAERIQAAQSALAQFGDDVLTITQDKGWWGMFGEGLVSDLKDFKNELDGFEGTSEELNKILNTDYGTNNTIKIAFKELQGEIKETAESINNFIVANNIKDPIQINEILSRAKAIIKTRNPEIKGELATLFDMQLDEQMSKFNSNIDKSSSLWEMFMERLKHNSSATFQDITSDIYKENSKLSKEQQNAVDENLEYFKNTMPFYYNAVKDMVNDASRLKIQIGIAFNVKALTDFQQEVNDRIAKAPKVLDFGTEAMLPTQNDNLQTWVKTQQDAIKGLREQNKLYKKDSSEWSKEQIKANNTEIKQRKNLLDLFNQSYEKEKKGGKKRDPMLDTLKQTVDIVKKLQSEYDTLTKSGDSSANALEDVRKRYSRTIAILNNSLQGYGLPQLNPEIIKGRNPNEILKYFQKISDILTNKGLSTLERQKAVEVVIQEFSLKAKTYNLDMITKGLNNELGKLKDEYELAVELDANPELGGIFADWMGFDIDNLPRTAQEYAKHATDSLNKAMKERKADIELPDLLNITDDDLRELQNKVGSGGITQTYVDEITKAVKEVRGVFKKEKEDTSKEWNALVEKYGDLQARMLKIYKDSVQEQVSIIKQFGNDEEIKNALDLAKSINISDDPAEIARLQQELAQYLKAVSERNPQALKIATASENKGKSEAAKATWDDFKNSELYTMTFEDMANNSTMAIEMIITKLEELKDKVKEDPASMKALMKQLEDARGELQARNPFKAIADGISDYINASKKAKASSERLATATQNLASKEQKLKEAQDSGDIQKVTDAKIELKVAQVKYNEAVEESVKDENKAKKARKDVVKGFKNLGDSIQNVSGAMSSVLGVIGEFADDDTKEAINDINKGFTIMAAVIGAVTTALTVLEETNPWVLAIAAALSVFAGLFSFLEGSSNRKISKQIEKSEQRVRSLENTYKRLEQAVNDAYGAMSTGARQAAIENKKLQLEELRRQYTLERSRTGKHYDEDKIQDLRGQIIDLENEIKNATDDIVNDLLGISSVGDALESFMGDFIEALRSGEDAMAVFDESIDEMIANMVKKMFTTKILQPWFEEQWNAIQKTIDDRSGDEADEVSRALDELEQRKSLYEQIKADLSAGNMSGNKMKWYQDVAKKVSGLNINSVEEFNEFAKNYKEYFEKYIKEAEDDLARKQEALNKASAVTADDIRRYAEMLRSGRPIVEENMQEVSDFLRELGLMNDTKEKTLSNLQQGISGITEDTAGAIEAYMNIVSQRMFYHGSLLEQIRDAVVGLNMDIQTATQAQMLLQLQQSYQVQMAIQGILEGWTNPSGQAVRVELIS